MRLGTLSLIALLGTTTVATAYDPYPFQRSDGKWGYVDDDHCWVIEPQFDDAQNFEEGHAAVRVRSSWGYVAPDGTLAIPPKFESASRFTSGVAKISSDGRFGFIDPAGDYVVTPQFEDADDFSEGLAAVSYAGNWGFLDRSGKFAINPLFKSASGFSDGIALVEEADGQVLYIDDTGAIALQSPHSRSGRFSYGIAPFTPNDHPFSTFGWMDKYGKTVIPPVWGGAFPAFSEGLASVSIRKNDGRELYGFINTSGDIVIPSSFEFAWHFSEGLAAVRLGTEIGFIDRIGNFAIKPQFSSFGFFDDGRAVLKSEAATQVIDRTGTVLLDPTCDHTR